MLNSPYLEELNELLRCAAGKATQVSMRERILASDYMNQSRGPVFEHFRNTLREAARKSRRELVKTLVVQGADKNAADADGVTPLAYAARVGATEVMEELFDRGLGVDEPCPDGMTALMAVAKRGDAGYPKPTDTARFLLERGASPNARDDDGWTPLMYAAHWRTPIVDLLVGAGADVNAQANDDTTALMLAAMHRDTKTARALLDAGADATVNEADNYGWTALTFASVNLHSAMLKALLGKGADPGKAAAPLRNTSNEAKALGFVTLYRQLPKPARNKYAPCSREALEGIAAGDASALKAALEKAVASQAKTGQGKKIMGATICGATIEDVVRAIREEVNQYDKEWSMPRNDLRPFAKDPVAYMEEHSPWLEAPFELARYAKRFAKDEAEADPAWKRAALLLENRLAAEVAFALGRAPKEIIRQRAKNLLFTGTQIVFKSFCDLVNYLGKPEKGHLLNI